MEDVFCDDTSNLEPDARDEITFSGWPADMIVHGVFEPLESARSSRGQITLHAEL